MLLVFLLCEGLFYVCPKENLLQMPPYRHRDFGCKSLHNKAMQVAGL